MSELLLEVTEKAQVKALMDAVDAVGKIAKRIVPTADNPETGKKTAPRLTVVDNCLTIGTDVAPITTCIEFDFAALVTKRNTKPLGECITANNITLNMSFYFDVSRTWLKTNKDNINLVQIYDDRLVFSHSVNKKLCLSLSHTEEDYTAINHVNERISESINFEKPALLLHENFEQDIVKNIPSDTPVFLLFNIDSQQVEFKPSIEYLPEDIKDKKYPLLRMLPKMMLPTEGKDASFTISLHENELSSDSKLVVFHNFSKGFTSYQYCKFSS